MSGKLSKTQNSKKKRGWRLSDTIIVAIIGAVTTIVVSLLPYVLRDDLDTVPTTIVTDINASKTQPVISTQTPEAVSLPATITSTEIMDVQGVLMKLVPSGEFIMGSNLQSDEQPIHPVSLASYYIDVYEVTNSLYVKCVEDGVCLPPRDVSSSTHTNYYASKSFGDHPVINVDWDMANTYCEWRGARLPSEAEWEKAARGVDGRTYPWGEDINCSYSNYSTACSGDTMKVGSFENGQSVYGVYDMAGNVWEWVSDWFQQDYYGVHHKSPNYQGPETGKWRVIRGGAWYGTDNLARSANRDFSLPFEYNFGIGFRCAKDAP